MTFVIYQITHKKSGRYYRGKTNLDYWNRKTYMGSGYIITRAIRKHGKDAFKREILSQWDNEADAYAEEERVVVPIDDDPLSYNLRKGGKGGYIASEKTRAKISKSMMGRVPYNKGKKGLVSADVRARMSASSTGKKHRPESIEKMRQSQKNRHRPKIPVQLWMVFEGKHNRKRGPKAKLPLMPHIPKKYDVPNHYVIIG